MTNFACVTSNCREREGRARNEIEQFHPQTAAQSARFQLAPAQTTAFAGCESARAQGHAISQPASACFYFKNRTGGRNLRGNLFRCTDRDAPVLFRESGVPPGDDRCADRWHTAARSVLKTADLREGENLFQVNLTHVPRVLMQLPQAVEVK